MYGSELTYSGDPVKRAIYLKIEETDPEALFKACWSEVDGHVTRCKEIYDYAYDAAYEANRERVGLREEMKSGRFWEYMQRMHRLEEISAEAARAAALEAASQVRLTSDLDAKLDELHRLNEEERGREGAEA